MSVLRFEPILRNGECCGPDFVETQDGGWVDYCDHAAAIAAKDSVIEELTNSLREVGEINSNARAEIARLKAENVCRDYRHHDFLAYTERFLDRQEEILAEGQAIIDAKEAEVNRLRKVVEAARWLMACRSTFYVASELWEAATKREAIPFSLGRALDVHETLLSIAEEALRNALAELEARNG